MYTVDTSATTQGNTKSTIQALLKNKEQCPIPMKPLPVDSSCEKGVFNNYSITSDFSELGAASPSLEFDIKRQTSPDLSSTNSQESLEYQKDFNYSQKLFHIADGNLYSIFSPIQGRSYGMKPSFLRKQKYTVQECHNRGRKNMRKGLKFHNFLPSESVTSEQDNGFLNTKWKVHSECRLREEHGTKQITISNWSQSVQNPPNENTNYGPKSLPSSSLSVPESNCTEQSLKCEDQNALDCKSKPVISDPYDFNLNTQQHSPPESINTHLKLNTVKNDTIQNSAVYSSPKKDSLNFVLNSLMEKPLPPSSLEKRSSTTDDFDSPNKLGQKHRRKPVQTRRIVPYVKYLSIMEENDSLPLDLSSKCLIENSSRSSVSSGDDAQSILGINDTDFINPGTLCDNSSKNSTENISSVNDNFCVPNVSSDKLVKSLSDGIIQTPLAAPVAVLYPLSLDKKSNLGQNRFSPPVFQESSNLKMQINTHHNVNNAFSTSVDKSYNMNPSVSNNSSFSVQKSFVKEVQSKPRRRNQRSAIKQKLEDTFRQNGFLVKTKQVSDGEATFCKFRQLRKYTRYYLKSLEQHLPDEFHKMWKGFLPPKTVLPPVVGTPDPSGDSPS